MCSKLPRGRVCLSAMASGTRASGLPRRLDGERTGCRDGRKAAGAALSAECGHTFAHCSLLDHMTNHTNYHQLRLDLITARITRSFGFSFLPSLELRPLTSTLLISHPNSRPPRPHLQPTFHPLLLSRACYPPWYSYVQPTHSFAIHFLLFIPVIWFATPVLFHLLFPRVLILSTTIAGRAHAIFPLPCHVGQWTFNY